MALDTVYNSYYDNIIPRAKSARAVFMLLIRPIWISDLMHRNLLIMKYKMH
jgi:hypothetical protein